MSVVDDFKRLKLNTYFSSKNNIKIIANHKIFKNINKIALEQLNTISKLPNIYKNIIGLPDLQPGYGLPVGSCFASEYKKGIISSAAVGYDIGCGIRLMKTNLNIKNIDKEKLNQISKNLTKLSLGLSNSGININNDEFLEMISKGINWSVSNNYCSKKNKRYIENLGYFKNAKIDFISKEAISRGKEQVGTLGQGNHFIDILKVDKIIDKVIAKKLGLEIGQLCIMIHSGSRGFGHQIAKEYNLSSKYKYPINYDLFNSENGQKYYYSMLAAGNFAYVNRSIINYEVNRVIKETLNVGQKDLLEDLLYDSIHNIVSIEKHNNKKLIIHRKGSVRVWARHELPENNVYFNTGSPIILPGSMLYPTFILVANKKIKKETFSTIPHGSGRILSRFDAKKMIDIKELKSLMLSKKIILSGRSENVMREEQPLSYRSSDDVVNSLLDLGLVKKIVKLKPVIVITG